MKKISLISAIGLTLALLTGCAGGPSAGSQQPEGSTSPTPEQPSQTPEEKGAFEVGMLSSQRKEYVYDGQNVSRLFYYYVPSTYQPGDKLPLMLTLHGSGSNAATQLYWGQWTTVAEENGFIVVIPESTAIHVDGTITSEGKTLPEIGQSDFSYLRWNASYTDPCGQLGVDDVQYLTDLVDLFVDEGYADPDRVYSCGFSHGGFMSMRLALEAPEKFAGVGVVSGLLCTEYTDVVPTEKVKIVFIQGTEDPVVGIDGMHYDFDGDGKMEYTWAYSLENSVKWWLDRYGVPNGPVHTELPDTDPDDGTRITRDEYAYENGTVQLVKYVVEGGGHTWPGGTDYVGSGRASRDAQASRLIWDELKDASK